MMDYTLYIPHSQKVVLITIKLDLITQRYILHFVTAYIKCWHLIRIRSLHFVFCMSCVIVHLRF